MNEFVLKNDAFRLKNRHTKYSPLGADAHGGKLRDHCVAADGYAGLEGAVGEDLVLAVEHQARGDLGAALLLEQGQRGADVVARLFVVGGVRRGVPVRHPALVLRL